MSGLDILYWSTLFLGGGYILLTLALGGVSHLVAQAQHGFDLGGSDAASTGHIGDAGGADVGHADVGHIDVGHADGGHMDVGDAHTNLGDGGPTGADGHEIGHHDHSVTDDGHHGTSLLAWLNPMMMSGLLFGFGSAGVLSRAAASGPLTSMAWAATGGGALYYAVWWIIFKVFRASQGSSHTKRDEFLGHIGQVMAPIEGSRPGMVYFTVAGTRQSVRAITEDAEAIPLGATVRIRRVRGNTALVTRVEDDLPLRSRVS